MALSFLDSDYHDELSDRADAARDEVVDALREALRDAAEGDTIYLQVKGEDGEPAGEVTWCDDRIFDTDVEYVRVMTPAPTGALSFDDPCPECGTGLDDLEDDDGNVIGICCWHCEFLQYAEKI